MLINVAQLLQDPIGTIRSYPVNEILDVSGDGSGGKIEGEVSLLHTQRGVLVRGKPRAEVGLTCSRCLSSFSRPVILDIEEEYIPTVDVVSGASLVLPEEPGYFVVDGHHVIDLNEAIRQDTSLAIPMKPLCREDCAGICQKCGQNLNKGSCDCPPQVVDPRWSALSRLL